MASAAVTMKVAESWRYPVKTMAGEKLVGSRRPQPGEADAYERVLGDAMEGAGTPPGPIGRTKGTTVEVRVPLGRGEP